MGTKSILGEMVDLEAVILEGEEARLTSSRARRGFSALYIRLRYEIVPFFFLTLYLVDDDFFTCET